MSVRAVGLTRNAQTALELARQLDAASPVEWESMLRDHEAKLLAEAARRADAGGRAVPFPARPGDPVRDLARERTRCVD